MTQELHGPDQVLDLRRGKFAETPAHLEIGPALADLGAMQRRLRNPPPPELLAFLAADFLCRLPLQL